MDLNICGVYKIKNRITGDTYIGSSNNVYKRFKGHIWRLKKNEHHSSILQHSYNKYGHDNFIFELICKCDNSLQYILEQAYIDSMKPYFNISKIALHLDYSWFKREGFCSYMKGRVPWNKGIKRTPEEKRYMSERLKLHLSKLPLEQKLANYERTKELLKTKKPFKGKTHSENRKKLIRKHRIANRNKFECVQTGKVYEAQLDAAKELGLRQGHISEHLQGKRSHVKGYTFVYVNEINDEYIKEKDLRYGIKTLT